MEAKSLRGLMQIVERAENVNTRIRALTVEDHDIRIPDVPLPLSLEKTEKWLELAAECCRQPLVARSKRLLETKGIATAAIPAVVLDRPESIDELLQRVDSLHEGLHAVAFDSLGRALTKGIEDAGSVIATFTAASRELNTLAGFEKWVIALAAETSAQTPSNAHAVVQIARRVGEYCNAAAHAGIQITPYLSLEDALTALTGLETSLRGYDGLLVSEGLYDERVSLTGLSVDDALTELLQATANVRSEKHRLKEEAQTIGSQLELIGSENRNTASTVAELRQLVPRLQDLLEEKRRISRASLGSNAFHVVESLAEGKLPTAQEVTDEELGNAIRKAIDCGYRFKLEAPHENR